MSEILEKISFAKFSLDELYVATAKNYNIKLIILEHEYIPLKTFDDVITVIHELILFKNNFKSSEYTLYWWGNNRTMDGNDTNVIFITVHNNSTDVSDKNIEIKFFGLTDKEKNTVSQMTKILTGTS